MSKILSPNQLRKKVELAAQKENKFIENCKSSTNPQTVVMVIQARARVEVLDAMRFALIGDNVLLNCLVG